MYIQTGDIGFNKGKGFGWWIRQFSRIQLVWLGIWPWKETFSHCWVFINIDGTLYIRETSPHGIRTLKWEETKYFKNIDRVRIRRFKSGLAVSQKARLFNWDARFRSKGYWTANYFWYALYMITGIWFPFWHREYKPGMEENCSYDCGWGLHLITGHFPKYWKLTPTSLFYNKNMEDVK